MDDKKTHDIWNDDDEDRRPRKKRHRLRRFLLFFLALIAVLAVVLVAAWRDGTGFDVLHRYFSYDQEGDSFTYDASSSNRFALLGERLVVLSDTSLRLLDRSGEEVWSVQVKMSAPFLATGGGRVVAYDIGGTELYVLDERAGWR